jgi:N-acetylmuramoyl-L-alanine amidase CwlA
MRVIQNLVPTSKYNIKCTYPMVAEFVVVHNTANDASAANEVAYMTTKKLFRAYQKTAMLGMQVMGAMVPEIEKG